jgi:hypothetical protein
MLAAAPRSLTAHLRERILGLVTGFEPATDCLQDSCSTVEPHQHPVTEVRIALTDLKGMNLPSHCCSISAYPWQESNLQHPWFKQAMSTRCITGAFGGLCRG